MTITLLFWILFLLWTLFGAWAYWPVNNDFKPLGGNLMLWLLLLLLGIGVYGSPIK